MGRTQSYQVKLDPFELIVYRLSPILGGRSEVLETPVLEALNYLAMERQERENRRLEQFHILFYAANSRVNPKDRKKFYDKLKPRGSGGRLLGNPKRKLEWDFSLLDEFRAKPEDKQ